jgi:hypothetical protein
VPLEFEKTFQSNSKFLRAMNPFEKRSVPREVSMKIQVGMLLTRTLIQKISGKAARDIGFNF